jgi:pyridoxamine 5'-phosphate oxidase
MSPFELFDQWYSEAENGGQIEPNALVLSSVKDDGRPSSRVVLLKHIENHVYYFFTNYNSDKAKALIANPFATYNFHWRSPLHRQVRIEGDVIRASREISDNYFKTRPRGSQIGAWSSPQSQPIENRSDLESRVKEFEKQFEGRDVPRPEYWGGFGLKPTRFEFWQEGQSRLHMRRLFVFDSTGKWNESLLAP